MAKWISKMWDEFKDAWRPVFVKQTRGPRIVLAISLLIAVSDRFDSIVSFLGKLRHVNAVLRFIIDAVQNTSVQLFLLVASLVWVGIACYLARPKGEFSTASVTLTSEPQPIFTAIDQLRTLLGRGQWLETAFQIPELTPKPTHHECDEWYNEVITCARQRIFERIITPLEMARFIEPWDNQDCRRAEAKLNRFGLLNGVAELGRLVFRTVFGRVKRLEELVAHIDGKSLPQREALRITHNGSSLACMSPTTFTTPDGSRVSGTIVRLKVETIIPHSVLGCTAALTCLEENGDAVLEGHYLSFLFTPAQDPNSDKKQIHPDRPEYLEVIWIPENGEAEIMADLPSAYEQCNPLRRENHYSLRIRFRADNANGASVILDAQFIDEGWQVALRQPS